MPDRGLRHRGLQRVGGLRSDGERDGLRDLLRLQRERELRHLDTVAAIGERRKAAYLDFLKGWEEQFIAVLAAKQAASAGSAPTIHMNSLYPCLVEVQIFGTRAAAALVTTAFETMSVWSHSSTTGDIDDLTVMDDLREQMRIDLAVPD